MKAEIKRYNLALTKDMFDKVQEIADENATSMLEVIRAFIKLGIYLKEHPGKNAEILVI